MLRTRVITALVMLAFLYVAAVILEPFFFALCITLVVLIASSEWGALMGLNGPVNKGVFILISAVLMLGIAPFIGLKPAASALDSSAVMTVCIVGVIFWLWAFKLMRDFPNKTATWTNTIVSALIGYLVLLPTWVALLQLKYLQSDGVLVFALIAMVSVADIGAYFVGRAFGNKKLAPQLSPGKSWAGFWGGVASCGLLSIALLLLLNRFVTPLSLMQSVSLIVLMLVVAVFSVLGDLFESMFKRNQGIKDSGSILPGHGGILDRIDSLTAAAPLFVVSLLLVLGDAVWA
ncbi:MAG: phosphatidate cytidylyltransferase [Pseudohongiellaceae bacterium]|nr:phosphatidate cytidylyltransferase [Pseudohongiellaceae bacterium]